MAKVCVYVRVSTQQQGQNGISLAAQEDKAVRFCELQEYEIIEVVKDIASGSSMKREGLQKVLSLIEQKKVDGLVVYNLSRLSRNTLSLLGMLQDFDKAGISFVSLTEKLDTSTSQGRFFITMLAAIHTLEREQLAERTKFALAHKKQLGQKLGGQCPYGFTSEDGRLVEVLNEQEIIKEVISARKEKLSLRQIAGRLQEKGYVSRTGVWHAKTVSNIIRYHAEV